MSKLASLIAVAAAIVAAVYLLRGERAGEAAEADAASTEPAAEPRPRFEDEPLRAAVTDEAAPSKREPASALVDGARGAEVAAWSPPAFEYELELRMLDPWDQADRSTQIFLAPAGHTLNAIGRVDLDGRLVVRWLGFEPRMQVDVAFEREEGLRRLELAAGFSSVALAQPIRSTTNWQASKVRSFTGSGGGTGARPRAAGTAVVPLRDAEGRLQFVEPLLYASGGSVDVPATVRQEPRGTASDSKSSERGALSVRIVDAEGAVVVDGVATVRKVGTTLGPSSMAIARGRILFTDLPVGEWDVRARSGRHGRAQTRVKLPAGDPIEWTAVLERGHVLAARLLDADRAPLVGWQVTVEALGRDDTCVRSATSDPEGRFLVTNLPASPLRVLARREQAASGSELLVVDSFWASEREQEFVLDTRAGAGLGELHTRLSCPAGTPTSIVRVCAWRGDTGNAVIGSAPSAVGSPSNFEATPALEQPLKVHGLEPGWYSLEIVTAAREPLVLRDLYIGASSSTEVPALAATEPASLALGGGGRPDEPTVLLELVHRGAATELRCVKKDWPGARGFLRPGDYRIVRTLGANRVERWLRAESGGVIELE